MSCPVVTQLQRAKKVPCAFDSVDLVTYQPKFFPLFRVHPSFPGFLRQLVRFPLEAVFHGSGNFRPIGFLVVLFRPLVKVVKGNFNFPVINLRVVVFHAVTVDQAIFIVGYENVNLAEIFRPKGNAARIAGDDRRALRLFRHFFCVDFLMGMDSEIAAVLRVEVRATIFVTAKLLCLVAPVAGNGVLVIVRRAVPLHCSPSGLCGLFVGFRLAVALIKRDAGNRCHEIAYFPLFLDFRHF